MTHSMRVVGAGAILLGIVLGNAWGQTATPPEPGAPSPTPAPVLPAAPSTSDRELLDQARQMQKEAVAEQNGDKLAGALRLVMEVLGRNELDLDANLLAGEISIDRNDYNAAQSYFKRVFDLEPSNFRANLGLGRIWNANRTWRQAEMHLERALKAVENSNRKADEASVLRQLAISRLGSGRVPNAVQDAERARLADPPNLDNYQTYVEVLLTAARQTPREYLERSVTEVDGYLKAVAEQWGADPSNRELLLRLLGAYQLQQAVLEALHNSYYQRDIRNQPTNELLPNRQAEAAAALNRMTACVEERAAVQRLLQLHDAVLLAERATQLDTSNLDYLWTKARLYAQIQNNKKAIETCEQILKTDPNHAPARELLGVLGVQPTESTAPAPATEETTPAPAAP